MNTVNSFFCGAGGFDIGFIKAGFKVVAAYDFDRFAVESYRHNIGNHVQQADVSKLTGKDIPFANGWLFGFPCQDISIAGKRKGMVAGETRSGLFFEIMRLLGEVEKKPSWILAENVKMVKEFIPMIEEEYKKAGYRLVTPQLYNSKYWGLGQTRERYFLLGIREDIELDFSFPVEDRSSVTKLASVLEKAVDEKYYVPKERADKIIIQAMEKAKARGGHDVDHSGMIEPPCGTIDKIGSMFGRSASGRCWNKNGISPTLTTSSGGYSQPLVLDDAADGYRVRRLTPREYARLQGFPDSYQQIVSDTQFYKQMGNAVSVNVAEAIAKTLFDTLTKASPF